MPIESLAISIRMVESTLIATLSGELDVASAPVLLAHLEPFRYRATRIVYELEALTFVDGTGLNSLLAFLNGDVGVVSFVNPSPPVRRVLEALDLDSMIEHPPVPSVARSS